MRKKRKFFYEFIAIVETNFQYRIVEYIISKKSIKKDDLLIIDLSKGVNKKRFEFSVNEKNYYLNFNTPVGIVKSLKSVLQLNDVDFRCNVLLSTYFFGWSTQYISNIIRAKERVMIDDGVGNFTFLKNKLTCYSDIKSRIKRLFVEYLILFQYRKRILDWSEINEYWSVYDFGREYFENFHLLKMWNFYFKDIDRRSYVVFVGSPVVEFSNFNKDIYTKHLLNIRSNSPDFIFLPHPDEKWYKDDPRIMEFTYTGDLCAEDFFCKEGLPENVYGFTSTVLLNLSYVSGITITYIKGDNHYLSSQIEDELFSQRGIKKYNS